MRFSFGLGLWLTRELRRCLVAGWLGLYRVLCLIESVVKSNWHYHGTIISHCLHLSLLPRHSRQTEACQSVVMANWPAKCCHSRDVTALEHLRVTRSTGCVTDRRMLLICLGLFSFRDLEAFLSICHVYVNSVQTNYLGNCLCVSLFVSACLCGCWCHHRGCDAPSHQSLVVEKRWG